MGPQRDAEMAAMYGVPVEVLRHGMPLVLQEAPDDEVQLGRYIRVATSRGLEDARKSMVAQAGASSSSTAPPPLALLAHIAPYLPPGDALSIRDMAKDKGSAGLRDVSIGNATVLCSKEASMMAIEGELSNVESIIGVLGRWRTRILQRQQPQEEGNHNPDGDLGLVVGENVKPLNTRYLVALIRAGKFAAARSVLKQIDLERYRRTYPESDGSPRLHACVEEAKIKHASADYLQMYPEVDDAKKIAQQLLGVISLSSFENMKALIEDHPDLIDPITDTLAELEKQREMYVELAEDPSLIGAAEADFRLL